MREPAGAGDQDHRVRRVVVENDELAGHVGKGPQQQKGGFALRVAEVKVGELFRYLENMLAQQRKAKGPLP